MEAPVLSIDRSSPRPIYLQIVSSIRKAIQNNEIEVGSRLPSIRGLAADLGVNRNTVGLAYAELESLGVVVSQVGSGTFVASEGGALVLGRPGEDRAASLERALAKRNRDGESILDRLPPAGDDLIQLGGMTPDSEFYPTDEFSEVLAEIFDDLGPSVLDYGSREGYPPLRHWLANRLQSSGAIVDEEDLFIMNGSQQGLDLVAKLLLDEGDSVIVESPTYYNAIGVFRLYGAELVPVALDDHGMRPDLLEKAIARRGAKLIYCMPTFQNPTGITMPRERRLEILEVAGRYGIPVLEDNFDSELRYQGEPETPLKGLPGGEDALLLGTFSKILFPGLRLGWLAVPPVFREALRRIRSYTDLSAGSLAQAAIHRFCERGLFDEHIDRVRIENAGRQKAMIRAMRKYFPDGVRWTEPDGGMSVWVTIPREVDTYELLVEARREGVNFTPGELLRFDGGGSNQMRLSFTLERAERIETGIKTIAKLMKCAIENGGARRRSANDFIL